MNRIALISCTSQKVDHAAPARDLYCSHLFRKSLHFAELTCGLTFVVSAFHGLLELDTVIEPYDRSLASMPKKSRIAWGGRIASALVPVLRELAPLELVFLAGEQYTWAIKYGLHFERFGASRRIGGLEINYVSPLDGLQIGERLRWFNRWERERQTRLGSLALELERDRNNSSSGVRALATTPLDVRHTRAVQGADRDETAHYDDSTEDDDAPES